MPIKDIGPEPHAFDIEAATVANENYRSVVWTGKYLQITLMSIPVGESIGLEVHPQTDQFLRLEAGTGRCVMGPAQDQLDFEQEVEDDWSVQVPAGMWHDIINTGSEPMKLYAIYAPVHHGSGSCRRPPRMPSATRSPVPTSRRRGQSSPTRPSPTTTPDSARVAGLAFLALVR